MRLHTLQIEAFGPFATYAAVDFDALSASGLFLLSGATGAGKTSVLDAVCFALYGDVPGDRSTAKRLRSDQAEPWATPRVTLEATLSGRRFRLARSPTWERPKKRGSGTTIQHATVAISELVGKEWQPLSSRLDESGDLVARLVGMNMTQFTQVAMLPQGRFQAFLRARSDDRHRLLQQLFRTGRFEQVERWVRDRRLTLAHEHEVAHQRVADRISRISETAGTTVPEDWDVHDLSPVADVGALGPWADVLSTDAGRHRQDAEVRTQRAAELETSTRDRLEEGRALLDRRRRLRAARDESIRLASAAEQHATDVVRLDSARRAATVLPLHRVAGTVAEAAATARSTADAGVALARDLRGRSVPFTELERAATAAADAATRARAAQPRADRLRVAQAEIRDVAEQRRLLDDEIASVGAEADVAPVRVESLRADLVAARTAEVRAVALRATCAVLVERADAHRQVAVLAPQADSARIEWLDARSARLDLTEQLVVLQQARVDGMAAELAGALAVGACCPVCGSDAHPHKADPAPGAPDAAAEKTARRAVDDAVLVEHAHDQKVRDLDTRLAAADARAGTGTSDGVAGELAAEQAQLGDALRLAARLVGLAAELEMSEADLGLLEARLAELRADQARAEARHSVLTVEISELRREIETLLAGTGRVDLPSLVIAHLEAERSCRTALAGLADAESAASSAAVTSHDLAAAVTEAGFASLDETLAAALDPEALSALDDIVCTHERRLAAVTEVLADDATDPADAPDPDVAALQTTHEAAAESSRRAGSDARLWSMRSERLAGLVTDLDRELVDWAPMRADLAVATRLSSFVEGKSADNRLRMRLSAYVLAYRLSQVVAAANERLAGMSDQRYSLEHTAHRGVGETRGGLSLLVRDDWSGDSRDPATLSGGETFVVSLALALGLADVIAHEAGGASLDTLFVDEGFGSLDADTLDDVMDTLDSLRDGGRVVGVVSHVAEMRDRIPTQLVVSKARTGSTVALSG